MKPEDIKKIKTFQQFSAGAVIRSGSDYVIDAFALEENNITAKGKVSFKTSVEDAILPIEMTWDMNGKALSVGPQFDLIQEEPFGGWD